MYNLFGCNGLLRPWHVGLKDIFTTSATYIMKKSTMESFEILSINQSVRSNCRIVILASDGGGGNTATTLEYEKI